MKTTNLFKITITIALIIVISSCHRERGCTDRSAINYNPSANVDNGSCQYTGQVAFWFNTNGPDATVTINGKTGTVSGYYSSGQPSCGDAGTATFTLPAGTYTYSASSSTFSWSDQITVYPNQCSVALLQQLYGSVSFWQSSNYPNTMVTINGQTQPITIYYTSGQPADCNTSGNANFSLPIGIYHYTAQSGSFTWSGDVTLDQTTCNLVHLN